MAADDRFMQAPIDIFTPTVQSPLRSDADKSHARTVARICVGATIPTRRHISTLNDPPSFGVGFCWHSPSQPSGSPARM